jgi:hypothetical protein
MSAIERLQHRLEQLPEDQREAMAAQVLEAWDALQWDMQMQADAETGTLEDDSPQAIDERRQAVAHVDRLRHYRKKHDLRLGRLRIRAVLDEGRR